jgi:hypothetical protein
MEETFYFSSFAEISANETEDSDDDASVAPDASDADECDSSLSQESDTKKPAAQKRKNEYCEKEEKGVKRKKVSVSILFFAHQKLVRIKVLKIFEVLNH